MFGDIRQTHLDKSTTSNTQHFIMIYALALLSLIAGAQAVGRAIVTNQCDAPLYLWSVGGEIGSPVKLTLDQSYSETFHRDPKSGGIAIKLTAVENGLFLPNVSQTIFAYNLDGNTIWYDMSDIFGDGFAGRTMVIKPTDMACESISWYGGKVGTLFAYTSSIN